MAPRETVSVAEIDIWRSAKLLIGQHGDEAAIHAAMRVDELLEANDLDGYTVWKRVLKAVSRPSNFVVWIPPFDMTYMRRQQKPTKIR